MSAPTISPSRMSKGDVIYRNAYRQIFPLSSQLDTPAGRLWLEGALVATAAALDAVGYTYDRPTPVPPCRPGTHDG